MSKLVHINDNLSVDRSFFEFLTNNNNLICSLILYAQTNPQINYISYHSSDMVSFLSMKKIMNNPGLGDPFNNKFRTSTKVGKLVHKIISEELINHHGVKDTHIESFVNLYKSWFDKSNYRFEVVNGEDIRKWYSVHNYDNPSIGTLWNSCMRYDERLKFLDLYCDNLKMLVMINKTDDGDKLRSRALLWDKSEVIRPKDRYPSEIKIMDRIYTIFDSDIILMKRWAEENGYITKFEQNSKSHRVFDIKGDPHLIDCKITLKNYKFKTYPYLDTFPYFDINNGYLYNTEFGNKWDYKLVQSNGNLSRRETEEDNEEDFELAFDDE